MLIRSGFLVAIYLEHHYFPVTCVCYTLHPFVGSRKQFTAYVCAGRGVRWGVQRGDSLVGLMLIPYREDSSALGYLT